MMPMIVSIYVLPEGRSQLCDAERALFNAPAAAAPSMSLFR